MPGPPPCPFGAPWESLTLGDVRSFLAGRPPERSTWEAKSQGSKGQVAEAVRREICGFSNRSGGYLLLGAEEQPYGSWGLPGLRLKGVRELHDWIASLLRDLQPTPLFDVHEWSLHNGSKVAIVQAEPAALTPVSHNGIVYVRHGTQTIRANGNAVRRLATQGGRAEKLLMKAARDEAQKSADQLWTPFGLAIARTGERTHALTEPQPEEALYEELEAALAGRFPARTRTRMIWDAAATKDFKDLGLKQRPPATFRGWRAAWMTEQATAARRPAISGRRRPLGRVPKIDPQFTDRDVWVAHLLPANIVSGLVFHMPVRRRAIEHEYGNRAIGNAALVLRALLATELRLGLREHEQLFIALALREWGPGEVVVIERQASATLKAVDWRRDVTAEAARKMHLTG